MNKHERRLISKAIAENKTRFSLSTSLEGFKVIGATFDELVEELMQREPTLEGTTIEKIEHSSHNNRTGRIGLEVQFCIYRLLVIHRLDNLVDKDQ